MDVAALDQLAICLAESGRIPDRIIRQAIRRMCAQRLREDVPDDPAEAIARTETFVQQMRQGPVAPVPQKGQRTALRGARRVRSSLRVLRQWRWPGSHYQRTANAWLANADRRRQRVRSIMAQTYGPAAAPVWQQRWRIFFMACAELFGYQGGRQWWVSHYRLGRR